MKPDTDHQPKAEQLEFFDLLSRKPQVVPDAVRIGPDLYVGAIPAEILPTVGFASLVKMPDGTMQPVVKTLRPYQKLTEDIGRRLNILCGDKDSRAVYFTIKRLIWSGMVKHKRLGSSYLLDLDSFWRFWSACGKPGFWNKERVARYKAARYGPDADEEEIEESAK